MSRSPHHPRTGPGDRARGDLRALAAHDNARWCDLVVRSHGGTGAADVDAWTSPTRTPDGYPDAVTLRPGVDSTALLSRIDTAAPGCSVKDSYADLDLSVHRFRELFAATWIGHSGVASQPLRPRPWRRVAGETVSAWEAAWGSTSPEPLFRPELLTAPGVTFLAAWDGPDIVAGCVLTARDTVAVGVSNVFVLDGDLERTWQEVLGWAGVYHPGVPLVGYEAGEDLAAAVEVGFVPLGPLTVWVADEHGPART